VLHPAFAQHADKYVRAFLLIQKDFQALFDYVEPSDVNHPCYSFRMHELLVRTCIEVEANFKAILAENDYDRLGDWNMGDYRKVNSTHRLSSYKVKVPYWHGVHNIRTPFAGWTAPAGGLPWYQAYNATKHDRHAEFPRANFENLVDGICGLLALLSSQFLDQDFGPGADLLSVGRPDDGFEPAIGSFFRVAYPQDFPVPERYEFDWQRLQNEADPFQNFPY
jgi:hypothetical protein